jgi:Protein of unknown function/Domain of unknown function (DUF1835)
VTTVHIAPNPASATSIRAALDAAGDNEVEVVECRDDLSYGPIDHSDRRVWWRRTITGDMGLLQEPFWDPADNDLRRVVATAPDARMIVWVGRRSAQEFANYLSLVGQLRVSSLHVIDVTGDNENAAFGKTAALPLTMISGYLGSERRLDDVERADLARWWSTLRNENAPFRVVSPAAQLVSAPIDHFDGALLAHVSAEPKPMTAVIAEAMAAQPYQTVDYMLQQRLIALIDAGAIAADGDPTTARMCLIRRISQ